MRQQSKEENIQEYKKLYKTVHGVAPRGLNLHNWDNVELIQGIQVLKFMRNY